MRPFAFVTLASVMLVLAACNRADGDRAAQAPAAERASAEAPPRFDGAPADPDAFAPRTDPRLAFAQTPKSKLPASKGGTSDDQQAHVEAQWAAAKASDTASADAAKEQVLEQHAQKHSSSDRAGTARDTPANDPRHGALTPGQESSSMPKAGQVNNHSSTALEASSGRPSM